MAFLLKLRVAPCNGFLFLFKNLGHLDDAHRVFHNDNSRQMAKDILKDIQVNTTIYFGTLTVVALVFRRLSL